MKKINSIILSLALSVLSLHGKAQINYSKEVDNLLKRSVHSNQPGYALMILKNGNVLYSKNSGLANIEHQVPITTKSVFNIASVSKQFTAFAILLLEDQSLISLEDKLIKYFPDFPEYTDDITIYDLLHHTSGIRDHVSLSMLAGLNPFTYGVSDERIYQLIKDQSKLEFPPGTKYSYSNSGYFLLSKIVEQISGKTFSEFTRENIFIPLEMNNTSFIDSNKTIISNRAFSYAKDDNGKFINTFSLSESVGAGGLYTSAEDFKKWIQNLHKNQLGNHPLKIQERIYEKGKYRNGKEHRYAGGLFISTYKNKFQRASHSGVSGSYRSLFFYFPEEDFAVFAFSNRSDFSLNLLEIADIYLFDKLPKNEDNKVSDIKTQRFSYEKLKTYTGIYQLSPGYLLHSKLNKVGKLTYTISGSSPQGIEPLNDSIFLQKESGIKLKFDSPKSHVSLIYPAMTMPPAKKISSAYSSKKFTETFNGEYHCKDLKTTVKIVNNQGFIELIVNHESIGKFYPVNNNTFYGNGATISFTKDTMNRIEKFEMSTGRVKNLVYRKEK